MRDVTCHAAPSRRRSRILLRTCNCLRSVLSASALSSRPPSGLRSIFRVASFASFSTLPGLLLDPCYHSPSRSGVLSACWSRKWIRPSLCRHDENCGISAGTLAALSREYRVAYVHLRYALVLCVQMRSAPMCAPQHHALISDSVILSAFPTACDKSDVMRPCQMVV